jgi:hypothetical protein
MKTDTMKKLFFLTIILLTTVILFAQEDNLTENYNNYLVGTWRLDTMEIKGAEIPPEYLPIIIEQYNKMKEKSRFIFDNDFKYTSIGTQTTKNGTWRISDDSRFILVKIEGSENEEKSRIIKLTSDSLVMAPTNQNSSNSTIYLYKSTNNE